MTKQPDHKLTTQQSDWLEKHKACEASGKSMKAFAISEGLNIQDLYSWKKMSSREKDTGEDTGKIPGSDQANHLKYIEKTTKIWLNICLKTLF